MASIIHHNSLRIFIGQIQGDFKSSFFVSAIRIKVKAIYTEKWPSWATRARWQWSNTKTIAQRSAIVTHCPIAIRNRGHNTFSEGGKAISISLRPAVSLGDLI